MAASGTATLRPVAPWQFAQTTTSGGNGVECPRMRAFNRTSPRNIAWPRARWPFGPVVLIAFVGREAPAGALARSNRGPAGETVAAAAAFACSSGL